MEEKADQKKKKENKVKPVKEKMLKVKESEYNGLIAEVADLKDKNIRLYAEFDNARKRMDRDKLEFVKYANENLIVEFLEILDDFERSVTVAQEKHEDYDAFLKGIEMVMARLSDMLSKQGVKPLDAKGKKFDPNCHEALMQEENNDVEDGTVLEEFQKGYLFGTKVIRTAKVKLSKKSEK